MVILFSGRFSRIERARQRRHIHLEDAGLTEKTEVRYYSALRKLLKFYEGVKNPEDYGAMRAWVHKTWASGDPTYSGGRPQRSITFSHGAKGAYHMPGSYLVLGARLRCPAGPRR